MSTELCVHTRTLLSADSCACAHVFVRGCACTIAFVLWEVAAALTVRERSSEGGQGGRGRGRPGLHSMDRVGTCSAQAALSYAALEPQRIVRIARARPPVLRSAPQLSAMHRTSPGADVGAVPAQMWARSRRRCGPVPAQTPMCASPGVSPNEDEGARRDETRQAYAVRGPSAMSRGDR